MSASREAAFRELLQATERIQQIKDLDALLDRILFEARRLTDSDAGSIYRVEDGALSFSHVQNDTLFGGEGGTKRRVYVSGRLPIDEMSIAGYVASTGLPLAIPDVYDIDPRYPFSFNTAFDERTGYRCRSMLTVPLSTRQGTLVGVLQVINRLSDTGEPIPYGAVDDLFVSHFATSASAALERARLTREIILRMIRMAEMRDPKETGAHVNRVGAYSTEIYDAWARKRGVEEEEINRTRDLLRIAAMLHDVGKVGISDVILKKPGRFDERERAIMKLHTIIGAEVFGNLTSDLDAMSREICLAHHEKWDGTGYPGTAYGEIDREDPTYPPGIAGEKIPLTGRIVALADVYDALCSRRAYKEAWEEPDVIDQIRKDTGTHFDPGVTEAFFAAYETVLSIREKFRDEE